MGAFDIDELRRQLGKVRTEDNSPAPQPAQDPVSQPTPQNPEQLKADCIAHCLELTQNFNAEADRRGLQRERITVGDIGVYQADLIPWPTEQEVAGLIFKKVVKEWADFHTVVYYQSDRNLPQYTIDVLFSAVIAPDNSCYLGRQRVSAQDFARYIATICDFDKDKADTVFNNALQRKPCITYDRPRPVS